ncbi:hypothetical protein WJX84_005753 [Apatococcus fuscideae]|uniref:F-box protein n=1 Tax=Apatococcus fuscideae TaxID=2026836 RepID=A0AAW1T8K9_9CHLO
MLLDPRGSGLGDLRDLPDQLVDRICRLLSVQDLLSLSRASKALARYCLDEPIWSCKASNLAGGVLKHQGTWWATVQALIQGLPQVGGTVPKSMSRPLAGFCPAFLQRRWLRRHADISNFCPCSWSASLPVVDASTLQPGSFLLRFDRPGQAVALANLQQDWAGQGMTLRALADHFGDCAFEVSKPTGGSILMRMADYVEYAAAQHDENPLYIFDSKFGEKAPGLLKMYQVPALFPEDLMACLGERQRPSYRWLVAGPARSGAEWHVDPTMTSAWNALLSGKKRWALYPPWRIPPGVVFHVDDDGDVEFNSPSPLEWFLDVYPTLAAGNRPLEHIQGLGETICVAESAFCNGTGSDVPEGYAENQGSLSVGSYLGSLHGKQQDSLQSPKQPSCLRAREAHLSDKGLRVSVAEGLDGAAEGSQPIGEAHERWTSSAAPPPEAFISEITGFSRSANMGLWVQTMWGAHPGLQPLLLHELERLAGIGLWQLRLAAALTAANVAADVAPAMPSPVQACPHQGGPCPVFLLDDVVVKMFSEDEEGHAQWASEVASYNFISDHSPALQRMTPRLLASGRLPPNSGLGFLDSPLEPARYVDVKAPDDHLPEVQILDFGDAAPGHPLLDFVVLHVRAFRGCGQMLAAALESYRISWSALHGDQPAWLAAGKDLPRMAMAHAMLHDQPLLEGLFHHHPGLWNSPSLAALKDAVWSSFSEA